MQSLLDGTAVNQRRCAYLNSSAGTGTGAANEETGEGEACRNGNSIKGSTSYCTVLCKMVKTRII